MEEACQDISMTAISILNFRGARGAKSPSSQIRDLKEYEHHGSVRNCARREIWRSELR